MGNSSHFASVLSIGRCLVASGLIASLVPAVGAEKFSKDELIGIAKYDDLPNEWRDRAVEAWKVAYKSAKGREKLILRKNDPRFLPDIFYSNGNRVASLAKGSWGQFHDDGRVFVQQITSKTQAICTFGDLTFVVDGIDTRNMQDKKAYSIPGPLCVEGNTTYETVIGASMTVFVVKPVPKKTERLD